MNKNWPTQIKDMYIAQEILEKYAEEHNTEAFGLFELFFDEKEKSMNFRLSDWVTRLAAHFFYLYGPTLGDQITRNVITQCLTGGQTIH